MAVPEPDDAARVFPEMKLLQQQKSKLTQLEQELFQRLWDAGYRPRRQRQGWQSAAETKLTQLEQELFQRLWDALCQPQTRRQSQGTGPDQAQASALLFAGKKAELDWKGCALQRK